MCETWMNNKAVGRRPTYYNNQDNNPGHYLNDTTARTLTPGHTNKPLGTMAKQQAPVKRQLAM